MCKTGLSRRSLLASFALAPTLAQAQSADASYPSKPVKLLVGVPPGGSTDAITRMLGSWLQEKFGQPFVVENRPGANTALAANAVSQARADGYTILVASDAYITVPLLTKGTYDPFNDFVPIAPLTVSPFVFVVHPSSSIRTVAELVQYAKAHPGELNYGSSGNGGASHLGGEKFKMLTGTDMVHIPYRGAGPALTDAISNQIQLSLWTPLACSSYVKSGRLRALAVTGPKRMPSMPDVPTFAEQGFPQYDHRTWLAVYARKGTPAAILDKIAAAIADMETSPVIKQKFDENGAEQLLISRAQFTDMMHKESDELVKLIQAADIKMD